MFPWLLRAEGRKTPSASPAHAGVLFMPTGTRKWVKKAVLEVKKQGEGASSAARISVQNSRFHGSLGRQTA